MRKLIYLVIVLGIYLSVTGCASIPKESAELSENLGVMLNDAKAAHFGMIDVYVEERHQRIDDYMKYVWTPQFIIAFMDQIDFDKAVCNLKGRMDRAYEMQEIVEAISKKVIAKRKELLRALRKTERMLRRKAREHYDRIELVNSAITSNLRSVVKVRELRNEVLKALSVPVEEIESSFDKANTELEKLMK